MELEERVEVGHGGSNHTNQHLTAEKLVEERCGNESASFQLGRYSLNKLKGKELFVWGIQSS